MPLEVIKIGNPLLREKCVPVTPFLRKKIENLRLAMIETLESEMGVGIAAPQVGFLYNMFVIKKEETEDEYLTFINPKVINYSEEKITFIEGCLSVPDVEEEIERPKYVKVKWMDEDFREHEKVLDEYTSRVFQHEYDHLNGILFVDRVESKGYELGI